MSDKPEALQMADELDRLGSQYDSEIAAELRRLHDLVTEDSILLRRQRDEIARLMALNAELVGALREMWELWNDNPAYGHEAADKARELLAKAQGEMK